MCYCNINIYIWTNYWLTTGIDIVVSETGIKSVFQQELILSDMCQGQTGPNCIMYTLGIIGYIRDVCCGYKVGCAGRTSVGQRVLLYLDTIIVSTVDK